MKKKLMAFIVALSIAVSSISVTAIAESNTAGGNAALSAEQLNSVVMLNYLTVLTQSINSSSNSRLYLEEAYSSLLNDTKPSAVDDETQYYLNNLLDVLENYRMIDVKRERLEYIYEQNKAQALREAVPNPLGLLSAVQSFNIKKIVASIAYMAIDSYSSYKSASTEADLQYLQDGWALDDSEATNLHNSRKQLFNYMLNISREYKLPDEMTLNESSVEEFVKWCNNKNVVQRVQFLESNENTYKSYGGYWLERARSYYEQEEYKKCLDSISEYEKLNIKIYRKDHEFAKALPLAIVAAEEVLPEKKYISEAERYSGLIEKNTENDEWDLRYCAAQTYINLYAKSKNEKYLEKAYKLALDNVNNLVDEQRELNKTYLAAVKEEEIPKDATKDEKKQIKSYNKMLNENRKKELPPVSEPLLLNCDLLFSLVGQLDVSNTEKTKIDGILHPAGEKLFLTTEIDNMYKFATEEEGQATDIIFDDNELQIPVKYLSSDATIKVTVFDTDSIAYEDWVLDEIDRNKSNNIDAFVATYKSKSIKKHDYTAESVIQIDVVPRSNSGCKTVSTSYKTTKYKKMGPVVFVEFGRVDK